MKLADVLNVVDDSIIIEVTLIDSKNVNTLLKDFSYYGLKDSFGFKANDMLRSKAIMKHSIYNVIKDYEVFYMTTSIYDYEYSGIRITLKVKEND